MEKGKVSFIVVNWNGRETITECLDSIEAQTYKNNEVIFVDNHSTDGSLDLVKEKYNIDKLISLDRNYGYAEANNIGFKRAKGEYIALVNNDVILENDWLEKAIDVFQGDEFKNVGSVATKNINYHHNNTWHDGNGHSHLRATLIGPSLTIPVKDQKLILGTWQQIIFLEFDNKPHHRDITVQIMGE